MKVRVWFPILLVIVLLSSLVAPLGAADEQPVTDAKRSFEDLEDMYEKGLIALQEFKEAATGLSPESPGNVLLGPLPEDHFFAEDFETWPPTGWTIVNNGGNCVWDSNTFYGRPNYAGGDGQCADADSDDCGSGTTMDTELQSPPIDLSTAPPGTYLEFVASYNDIGTGDVAQVWVSPDGGITWDLALAWDEDHSPSGPGEVVGIDMTPYVGNTDVIISFRYIADGWDWWFEVDQVRVLSPSPNLGESTKEVFPAKAVPGDILDYTIQIRNTGDAPALATLMTDPIPAGSTYVTDSLACSSGNCWYDEGENTVYWEGEVGLPTPAQTAPREFSLTQPEMLGPIPDVPLQLLAESDNVVGAPAAPVDPEAVLWEQPTNLMGAPASQYFPDFGAGLWSADDFENTDMWAIDTIYVPGSLWNGNPQGDLFDAYDLNWFIYADAGNTPPPGVYPDDGSGTEIWSLSLAPTDPAVTISGATNNEATLDVVTALGGPLLLPPGHYWLAFFPSMDFTPHGQFGWQTSGTMNLASAHFADPDGLISPLDWTPWGIVINPAYYDAAFRLEGAVLPPEIEVTFQVQVVDPPCGEPLVNEALIEDPQAQPVVVEAAAEIWDIVSLHEGFEGTFPPAGWMVNDYAGSGAPGSVWDTANPGGHDNMTGGSGLFAIVDDDVAGSGVAVETDMWLPPIDIPTCQDTYLSFKTDYNNISSNETAAVDISLDGGGTWENLLTWNGDVRGPHTEMIPLGGYAGAMGAIIRFYYDDGGAWAWWWEIDDVQIVSCVKEGLFLTPEYQASAGCPGEILPYALSLENCTGATETFGLYATGNDWPTWVEPGEIEVPDGGIVDVTAYVQGPCSAEGSDLVTIVAEDGGYSDTAEIESAASAGPLVEWEVMAPLPEGRVFEAVVGTEDYVYVIGGTSDAGGTIPTDTNFRYDIANDAWDTMAPMPTALESINGGLVGDKIYVPGGDGDANTYVYDIPGDSWSVIQPSGTFEWGIQYSTAVDGDILYRLGGLVDDGAGSYVSTNQVWALDTVSELWTELPPMQQDRTSFAAGAIGGNLYVAGGVHFPGFAPEMTSEKFEGGVWSYVAPVPDGGGAYTRWSYNADATAQSKLWLMAGRRDANWNVVDHTGSYDPATDSWTTTPDLPLLNQGRVYLQGAAAGDFLFAIGGRDPAAATIYDVNERLRIIPCPEVEANIDVWAPALEEVLYEGETASEDLGICNTGTCPLEFELGPAIPWLGFAPELGVLPTTWCEEVGLTFDATGMAAGHYMATLDITSNDPDTPVVSLDAHLTVMGRIYLPLIFKNH